MTGIFCTGNIKNNEEYKKLIKARMKMMIIFFLAGAIALAVAVLVLNTGTFTISDYMLGVYTGVGAGLMMLSIIFWIKSKLILADEEKLKENRLRATDERLMEIRQKALRFATCILLIVLYLIGLIGGLYNSIITYMIWGVVILFVLVFFIAYRIIEKRM